MTGRVNLNPRTSFSATRQGCECDVRLCNGFLVVHLKHCQTSKSGIQHTTTVLVVLSGLNRMRFSGQESQTPRLMGHDHTHNVRVIVSVQSSKPRDMHFVALVRYE